MAGWNVENQGDVTAKASLRLRMGATRILATSVPVEVIAGSRKTLGLLWSIPSDMKLGQHNLVMDIEQIWQVDGATHRKVVASHGVSLDVVKGRAAKSAFSPGSGRDASLFEGL